MPGVTIASGSSAPSATISSTCATVQRRRGRHDRAEVARRLAVDEVAPAVGLERLDQGDVGVDRILEHVVAAVDRRASPCRSASSVPKPVGVKNAADAGAGRADPLGEVALRHQLEFDLAGAVEPVEDLASRAWRGNEQMILRTRPRLEQRGQPGVAVARVVADDGQVGRALLKQRVDQRRSGVRRDRSRRSSRSRRPAMPASAAAASATILSLTCRPRRVHLARMRNALFAAGTPE